MVPSLGSLDIFGLQLPEALANTVSGEVFWELYSPTTGHFLLWIYGSFIAKHLEQGSDMLLPGIGFSLWKHHVYTRATEGCRSQNMLLKYLCLLVTVVSMWVEKWR